MNDEQTLEGLKKLSSDKPFRIPTYQRGYRWQHINVTDLLNDLWDFIHDDRQSYSLQPLVVKDNETYWNVVDGQQRLTTLKILLNYLEPNSQHYEVICASRPNQKFIDVKDETNIDQYHINRAFNTISEWFNEDEMKKQDFIELLHDRLNAPIQKRVKFIWFVTQDDEVRTFIRINKNKISLTNAELIKAMLLRKGNFGMESTLMQKNIASEWNAMEDTFHDDSFWYFLRPKTDKSATRIDYVFRIIKDKDLLNFRVDEAIIGTDQYATFRYFNEFFKNNNKKEEAFFIIWKEVIRIYNIFVHWYNEVDLYHYIGLLVVHDSDIIPSLLDEWNKCDSTTETFKQNLYYRIKNALGKTAALKTIYELKGCPKKTKCFFLLLLFNVETILIRNRNMQQIAEVQIPHKFPFYLLKKENWDIEHIASNTENDIEDKKSQSEWLKTFLLDNQITEEDKTIIGKFILEGEGDFDSIRTKLLLTQDKAIVHSEKLSSDEEKNQLWNFCLLDKSTNRSYGNSIFPIKRRIIMGKELGEKYDVAVEYNKDKQMQIEVIKREGNIAYVPTCTMNVFLKAYTSTTTSAREWTRSDAEAYLQQIYDTLHEKFGVTK